MVPSTGAKPLRRASRVCEVSTRASATRSADTAASRLACVPAPVLLREARAVIALLGIGERRLVLVEVGLLQIVVHGIKRLAGLDLVALADMSFVTRPNSSGLTKIMSASTQP